LTTTAPHITALNQLPAFFELLKSKGIYLDIDDYPRVYQLAHKAGDVEELKRLLCPLIVNSNEEQTLFHELFDQFYVEFSSRKSRNEETIRKSIQPDLRTSESDSSISFSKSILKKIASPYIFILAVILLFVFIFWFYPTFLLGVFIGGIIFPLFIALGVDHFRKMQSKKLVARRTQSKAPPYFLKIDLDLKNRIHLENELPILAKQLRRRLPGTVPYLNVNHTLKETIKNGGALQLKYNYRTKPAEYLFLIDHTSVADHQSQLFEWLYRQLLKNNVYAERFFYKEDMRVCWNEDHSEGVSLEKLAQRYKDYRLIIFGDGWKMINPVSGYLMDWTSIFHNWKDKALMTSKPSASWSYDELHLSDLFVVLPSNIDGMLEVVNHFEKLKKSNLKEWRDIYAQPEISLDATDVKSSLKEHFSEPLQIWIAACAVYPEITWDLTIYLGELLSAKQNENLLSFSNIVKLAQLPWMKTGKMPEEVRKQLLSFLDKETWRNIHQKLVNILEKQNEKNQLPVVSAAYSQFKMQLAVHKLQSGEFQEEEHALKREIVDLIDEGVDHDFIALQSVSKVKEGDFVLPGGFEGWRYEEREKINPEVGEKYLRLLSKRLFDIFFSLSVLILLFPIYLLIWIIIYFDGKGSSVIYMPMRTGVNRKIFKCYKFRTIAISKKAFFNEVRAVESPRITRIGKYLRKFDLDGLPQFFNVLIGDMSIVGPGPERYLLSGEYKETVYAEMEKYYLKPGITGWAQVNGWRGERGFGEKQNERINHDLWYIQNWSLFLDIKIIFLTVFGREARTHLWKETENLKEEETVIPNEKGHETETGVTIDAVEEILILISNNFIDKAIQRIKLILSSDSRLINELSLIENNYNSLSKENELVPFEEFELNRTKIKAALLELVKSIKSSNVRDGKGDKKDSKQINFINNRRFSLEVKKVISLAKDEAIRLGQEFIGSEHLLIAILKIENNRGLRVLISLDVNREELITIIEESVSFISNENIETSLNVGNLPLTKRAEKILKVTFLEAKSLGDADIGSEHLLLSILKHQASIAALTLVEFDINYEIFKSELEYVKQDEERLNDIDDSIQEEARFYSEEELKAFGAPVPFGTKNTPLNVFLSYAHEDLRFKEQLVKLFVAHLKDENVMLWDRAMNAVGQGWNKKTVDNIKKADIIILLLSPEYLSSKYIENVELDNAFSLESNAFIIPIIIRPCLWEKELPKHNLQILPINKLAISSWGNPDEAYEEIMKYLETIIKELRKIK